MAGVSKKGLTLRLERAYVRRLWLEFYATSALLSDERVQSASKQLAGVLAGTSNRHFDSSGKPIASVVEALEHYVEALTTGNRRWRQELSVFLRRLRAIGAEDAFAALVNSGAHPEFMQDQLVEYLDGRSGTTQTFVARGTVSNIATQCRRLASAYELMQNSFAFPATPRIRLAEAKDMAVLLRRQSDWLLDATGRHSARKQRHYEDRIVNTLLAYLVHVTERLRFSALGELMDAIDSGAEQRGSYSQAALRKRFDRMDAQARPGTWIAVIMDEDRRAAAIRRSQRRGARAGSLRPSSVSSDRQRWAR
jgi:hypothetical protein